MSVVFVCGWFLYVSICEWPDMFVSALVEVRSNHDKPILPVCGNQTGLPAAFITYAVSYT